MSIAPNVLIGPYQIQSLIGAGGMGEVYRARDTTLGRDVALKVLPDSFSRDPDRLARFEREARTLATLNHPHIAQIYGFQSAGTIRALAMELVDGDDLGARISRGRLPVEEALGIARQIAEAIEAAHEQGVIHRDLKPSNIKVRPDGMVKVLDFGLAKALDRSSGAVEPVMLANSPTMASPAVTMSGVILGTAGYMAPEQAKGKPLDKRADVWAFGCVLYEMLTGTGPFRGDTVSEILAAVIHQPPDFTALPPDTPSSIVALLERCLRVDPRQRLRDIGDARLEIEEALTPRPIPAVAATQREPLGHRRGITALLALAVMSAAFTAGWTMRSSPAGESVEPPPWRQLTFRQGYVHNARVSTDGQTVIYSAAWDGQPMQVFSTTTVSPESRAIEVPAAGLFGVSPTGQLALSLSCRFIMAAATCRGTLAQAPLVGGAPRAIAANVVAADWGTGDQLAVVREDQGQQVLEFPVGTRLSDNAQGHVRVSRDGRRVTWSERMPSGFMVMVRDDSGTRAVGPEWRFVSALAWSSDGSAVYVSGQRPAEVGSDLVRRLWLDGREENVLRSGDRLRALDATTDGRLLVDRAAVADAITVRQLGNPASPGRDLTWLGSSVADALSADGRTVLFTERGPSARPGSFDIYVRPTNGGPAVRLGTGEGRALSDDGQWALTSARAGPSELVLYPLGPGMPRPLDRGGLEVGASAAYPADFVGASRVIFRARKDAGPWQTYVQSIDGGPPVLLSHEPGFITAPVSPDGTRFTSRRGDGSVWIASIMPGDAAALPAKLADKPDDRRVDRGRARALRLHQKRGLRVDRATRSGDGPGDESRGRAATAPGGLRRLLR
jgi:eukaryotic-like serine/threonine-protein kinase